MFLKIYENNSFSKVPSFEGGGVVKAIINNSIKTLSKKKQFFTGIYS